MTGYSQSPITLKGALIEMSERFIGPVPNVIVFQYNPETLDRSLTPWTPAAPEASEDGSGSDESAPPQLAGIQMSQPFDPEESFTLDLILDAHDALEFPDTHPVAVVSGVADRISAMELLLYPDKEGSGLLGDLVDTVSNALGGTSAANSESVPRYTVPIVLFAWGPGRILPVRVTSFGVQEQQFSPTLYPIRAKVSIGLKVLIPEDLAGYPDGIKKDLAINAYKYTQGQKGLLAASNSLNSVESVLGMLPF